MIHQDVALHNVVELESAPGGGTFLRRYPAEIRNILSPLGRIVSQDAAGVEIRFVTDSASFRLDIASLPNVLSPWEMHHQDLVIFRGAFLHSHHRLTPGRINHINVANFGGVEAFDAVTASAARGCGFAPNVWRILLGRYPAVFHGLDTYGHARRPPKPDELPKHRWIAYGSSITNGASPTVHHNSYLYHAARQASLDVFNLGLSGACLCEAQVADHLAGRDDWDVMTLELGVNMRGHVEADEFRRRAEEMLWKITTRHPDRRLVLITIFPNAATTAHTATPDAPVSVRQDAFDDILRQLAAGRNITLIEGSDILDDFACLSVDLIHPSDYGHARMGMNLGRNLSDLLALT